MAPEDGYCVMYSELASTIACVAGVVRQALRLGRRADADGLAVVEERHVLARERVEQEAPRGAAIGLRYLERSAGAWLLRSSKSVA